jgi:2-iminobutanoate/2-iminopropanoate deaminase
VSAAGDGAAHGIRAVSTGDAPGHSGPVPQAVEAGGWVFVSALFGADPATGEVPADAGDEAARLFTNLEAILRAAGTDLAGVVRVGLFMRDLQGDRPALNAAWRERFGDHRPARFAVGVTDFGRAGDRARFMLEVTALRR